MENKKYSLLVIALYCYSGHVKAVINHLKAKNPLVDLTLLTEKPDEFRNNLADKSVKIVSYDVKMPNIKNRRIRAWVIKYRQNKFFSQFSKNRKYDIVNVHFPKRYLTYAYKYIRRMSDNFVITPWGSDVFRLDDENALNRMQSVYAMASCVTCNPTSQLGSAVVEKFKFDPQKMVPPSRRP